MLSTESLMDLYSLVVVCTSLRLLDNSFALGQLTPPPSGELDERVVGVDSQGNEPEEGRRSEGLHSIL